MTNSYNAPGQEKEPVSLYQILLVFWKALKKMWPIMVILIVVMGIIGYSRYRKSYVPAYETKATFSITAPQYDGTEDRSYTNNNELASILSVSFDYLINNEVFYEIIKNDLGIDSIPCTITISAVPETNILSIVTSGSDREMSYKVVESVLKNYGSVAEFVIGDTTLDVLEEPVMPKEPVNPYAPLKSVMMFGLIGMFIGAVPVVLYGLFVKKIRSKEDVEKELNVNFLGMLPQVFSEKKNESINCSIANKEVGFNYLEAMRSINSKCEKQMEKNNYKVILVTSTAEGEGKSTLALNLAYSLSKTQKKVMLIDGDLRNPSLYKMVDQKMNSYKMEDFLGKRMKSSQAIVNLEGTRVLMLAPDKKSKNAVRVLNSPEMEQFIQDGRDVVDYIIIDAPACSGLSDAAILAKYSDAVIYVVKEEFVKVNKIIDTLQEFSYTRTPIMGCVLNHSSGQMSFAYGKRYGYGRRYGYGKRYGKGYGYGKRYGYGGYYGKAYGYGSYGVYGTVSEKEFDKESHKVSRKISLKTTDEQRKALEEERKALEESKAQEAEQEQKAKDNAKDKA